MLKFIEIIEIAIDQLIDFLLTALLSEILLANISDRA